MFGQAEGCGWGFQNGIQILANEPNYIANEQHKDSDLSGEKKN